MRRRDFLKVVGLSVATPSFLVAEDGTPPKRQNPDFIKTGFPTIDYCLGGGFHRGTFNSVYGYNNQSYHTSLLLKTIALKAASDLQQRCSVLLISPQQRYESNQSTPFDGLLTKTDFVDWSSLGMYDLVIIDQLEKTNWKYEYTICRPLQRIAFENNMVIVQRQFLSNGSFPSPTLPMYVATSALTIKNHSNNMQMRLPTLEITKNRYGLCTTIELTRRSLHFYDEA